MEVLFIGKVRLAMKYSAVGLNLQFDAQQTFDWKKGYHSRNESKSNLIIVVSLFFNRFGAHMFLKKNLKVMYSTPKSAHVFCFVFESFFFAFANLPSVFRWLVSSPENFTALPGRQAQVMEPDGWREDGF